VSEYVDFSFFYLPSGNKIVFVCVFNYLVV